mmetsp:Transcript_3603/g.6454  ORF Transcript_3603/g.6454 Transcript_3603/m.6454 type:complete len:333 (-) Transcript_3603:299-1297(-)
MASICPVRNLGMTFDLLDNELVGLILSYASGRRKQDDEGYDIDIRALWMLRSVSRLFKTVIDEWILRFKKDMVLRLGYHSLEVSGTSELSSERTGSISSTDHEHSSARRQRESLINMLTKARCLESIFFQGGSNGIDDELLKQVQGVVAQLRVLSLQQCCRFTFRGLVGFGQVKELDLSHCRQVDDQFIADLSSFPQDGDSTTGVGERQTFLSQLVHLRLRWCTGISDQAMKHISQHCRKLKILDLNGCENVTDYGVADLACNREIRENLEELYVSYCYIGDVGLSELDKFSGLRVVALAHQLYNNFPSGHWSAVGMRRLMRRHPELRIVYQ